MKEIRQTDQYSNYLKSQGWKIEKIGKDYVYIKKLGILGSVLKLQRPEKPDFKKLKEISKKYRSFYTVVELRDHKRYKDFLNNGFKVVNPFLPSKTLVLDINKSKEKIFESFTKNARYSIRKANKELVKEEINIEKFNKSWNNAAARGRYILSVSQINEYKKSFAENMILLTNSKGDSGAMFLVADGIGYYWYGFTSNSARATEVQYKIIFEGILWAKSRGAKKFDFEGIYDERFPNKAWVGFSKFKKRFAGKEIEYPPALGKWSIRNFLGI